MPFRPLKNHLQALVLAAAAGATPLGFGGPALADDCANSFAQVAQKMQNGPQSMPSYSAGVRVHARMHGFPFLGMTFNGTSTYERPGNYSLSLNNPPRGADQFEALVHDLFADITSSNYWSRYDATPSCAPRGQLIVHLTPKTAGDTKALDLLIDPESAHVMRATFARSDGTITIDQRFSSIQGHDVIVHQDVGLAMTRVHADVAADYHDINLTTVVAGR